MNDTASDSLPAELEGTLTRYLELQSEERRIKEEKQALQDKLAAHMQHIQRALWQPVVHGQPLKIRCAELTDIEYDEDLLKERLGERYAALLAPDPAKVRRELATLAPLLQPALAQIGSPTPDKVRAAIESGLVKKEEFAGAFTKTVRRQVAVSRQERAATSAAPTAAASSNGTASRRP